MSSPPPAPDPILSWRQGDFAVDVGGFSFADISSEGMPYDLEEQTEGISGLVVVSQSCDIVRESGERYWVSVCPLIQASPATLSDALRGKRPYLALVENAPEGVVADLSRVMSVSKSLLRSWKREIGFNCEEKRRKFSFALARKLGNFAFPDEFDIAIGDFKNRVWSRHNKESEVGGAYRSIMQIRFQATPSWDATQRTITMVAVLESVDRREDGIDLAKIEKELRSQISKINWPNGFEWATEPLILDVPESLSADLILTSEAADFEYLCV